MVGVGAGISQEKEVLGAGDRAEEGLSLGNVGAGTGRR